MTRIMKDGVLASFKQRSSYTPTEKENIIKLEKVTKKFSWIKSTGWDQLTYPVFTLRVDYDSVHICENSNIQGRVASQSETKWCPIEWKPWLSRIASEDRRQVHLFAPYKVIGILNSSYHCVHHSVSIMHSNYVLQTTFLR